MIFQIDSRACKHISKFIIFNGKMKDPYSNERYQFKNTENFSRLSEFTHIQHQKEEEWTKVFDDRTLEFMSKNTDMLDVSKLDLSSSQITDGGIYALAMSKNAQNIVAIDLSRNSHNIQDVALRFIADSPNLQQITSLYLRDTAITDNGIYYLFYPYVQSLSIDTQYAISNYQRTKARRLADTKYTGTNLHTHSVQMTSPSDSQTQYSEIRGSILRLHNLKVLQLQGNISITDKSMECITYSHNIRLKYLDVSFTQITDLGMMDYFQSPNSAELEYLNVSHQKITDLSIKAYAESAHCKSLICLHLFGCPISNKSVDYLSQSENTKVLEELDIGTDSKNPELNDDALIRLICAKYLSKLRVLNIAGQNFTEVRMEKLLRAPIMRSIEQLSLSGNHEITDSFCQTLKMLLEQQGSELQLKRINLFKTSITHMGVEILQKVLDVSHSIMNMPSLVSIQQQTKTGIKLYLCDRCVIDQDQKDGVNPQVCIICRSRQITSVEAPAKLCVGCGDKYQHKNCYGCGRYEAGKHGLYRCFACSIGNNKFKCIICDKMIKY